MSIKAPFCVCKSEAFLLSEKVDNYIYKVERSGVYSYASGKKWYLIKNMKFITTEKKVSVAGKAMNTKVVRVAGVKIRVPVLVARSSKK